MGRKKKRKQAKKEPQPNRQDVALAESRSADAATVGWTLAAMCTLGALALRGLVQLMIRNTADQKSLPEAAFYIPPLMLFTALVIGTLAVSATPIVYRLRRTTPPWQVTTVIVLIGIAPLILLVMNW